MACKECGKLRKRVDAHEETLHTLTYGVVFALVLAWVAWLRDGKED